MPLLMAITAFRQGRERLVLNAVTCTISILLKTQFDTKYYLVRPANHKYKMLSIFSFFILHVRLLYVFLNKALYVVFIFFVDAYIVFHLQKYLVNFRSDVSFTKLETFLQISAM